MVFTWARIDTPKADYSVLCYAVSHSCRRSEPIKSLSKDHSSGLSHPPHEYYLPTFVISGKNFVVSFQFLEWLNGGFFLINFHVENSDLLKDQYKYIVIIINILI